MSELLSDRMERVERALRDLEGSNRQLAGLLTQAIKSGAGGAVTSPQPVAQEPARKRPQGAGEAILGASVGVDAAKAPPASDEEASRQLADLLARTATSPQEPAGKRPQGAGGAILNALIGSDGTKPRPPQQGLGQRLKEFAERQAQEAADRRPSP